MAVLVDIKRMTEERSYADYSFTVAEATRPGILRIDKTTGDIVLIQPIEGSVAADENFHRAAYKIRQYWKRGILPETAVWAS